MLVGRLGELTALDARLAGLGCCVAVLGEAGVGKTTLIRRAARAGTRRVFEGGALATLSWSAYLPLRRALNDVTAVRGEGGSAAAGATARMWAGDPEFVAAALEERIGDGLLVIDDLQWADAGTRAVIRILVGRVPIVSAVRRGDPGAEAALALLADAGFETIDLEPLDAEHAQQLARRVGAELDENAIRSIAHRSGGNPLLIEELAAGDSNVQSLRLSVAARIRALPAEAVTGLELLSLAGRPLPEHELPGAEALRAAGLSIADTDGVTMRHTLIAEVVVDDLEKSREIELHRMLAAFLNHPGDAARHHLLAGDFAAGYAAAILAVESAPTPGERSAHLITAASCAPAAGEPELRLRAAGAAAEAAEFGDLDEILAGLPDTDEIQVKVALIRARAAAEAGDYDSWSTLVDRGLERCASGKLGTSGSLGRNAAAEIAAAEVALLAERAKVVLLAQQDFETALDLARMAVQRADRLGVYRGRAYYILGTIQYYIGDGRWEENLGRSLEFARAENDLGIEFVTANNLVVCHESAGSPVTGARIAEQMMARADDLQLLRWRRHFWSARLNLAMHAGDYRLVVESAPQLLAGSVMRRTREEVSSAWALCLLNLGQLDEGLALGEEALTESTLHRSNLYHLRVVAAELAGRPEDALAELPAFLDCVENPHRIALAAPVFQWSALQAGMPAVKLPDLTEAFELTMLHAVPEELAGIDCLRASDAQAAAAHFQRAAELWQPYHRQGEVRCRWASGRALADSGSEQEAVAEFLDVEQLARRHEMAPMLARIEKALRTLGVQRSAPRGTDRAGELTPRERQVLDLIGRGLSDTTIAVRLGVSARTVESHVLSARRKLGAANRLQAVALAQAQDAP